MSKKRGTRERKIPMRKCIVSQEMHPKVDLVRIVKTKEGEVFLDPTGRQNGRGAYIALDLDVANQAKQERAFDRILGIQVEEDFYDEVIAYVDHQLARRELQEQMK